MKFSPYAQAQRGEFDGAESVSFSPLRPTNQRKAHAFRYRVGLAKCARALALLALAVAVAIGSGSAFAQITAPARNWVLPIFTKEGFRAMVARGSEARQVDVHQFEVTDLNLTMFSSDQAARVDNVILSPAATFLPEAKTAHGEKAVRFIGKGVEASGVRWIYFHDLKKISLDGSVHVTFEAELKNLLQ